MRSHLLVGQVGHRRLKDLDYRLMHDVWYLALDLDEVGEVDRRLLLLSHDGANVAQLLDRDHLGRDEGYEGGLGEAVRAHLSGRGLPEQDWRITLVTLPRVLGFVFNPVSFYLCHERTSDRLAHVIAEVHNTHGEREVYDFAPEPDEDSPRVFRSHSKKRFYVSPYIDADAEYELTVVEDDAQLAVHLRESEGDTPVLDAGVRLYRRPLTNRSLLGVLAAQPFAGLRTLALIGWHVTKMRLRGMAWESHTPREEYQQRISEAERAASIGSGRR